MSVKNELYDLDVGETKDGILKDDSEIFSVPCTKKLDEVIVVVDSLSTKRTHFLMLRNLIGQPTLSLKKLDNFRRPFNNDKTLSENKLVAYLN